MQPAIIRANLNTPHPINTAVGFTSGGTPVAWADGEGGVDVSPPLHRDPRDLWGPWRILLREHEAAWGVPAIQYSWHSHAERPHSLEDYLRSCGSSPAGVAAWVLVLNAHYPSQVVTGHSWTSKLVKFRVRP